jgi:uncharacterized damage-inducible protein DinB
MYTPESLIDIHERSHRSLKKLLDHCNQFTTDELNREMPGFGYPTMRLQLHHIISAEEYWIGVLHGRIIDENDALYPNIESLEKYRQEIYGVTHHYLKSVSNEELNTPRKMITWQNKERILTPAHVVMRTQTHLYQHQGQILAICRLLGKPATGMDFPIV